MSKDNNPRSDDPLTPRDVTILRPRPGVSRRPAPQPGPGAGSPQSPPGADLTAPDGPAGSAYGQSAPVSEPPAAPSGYGTPPAYSAPQSPSGGHADARGAAEASLGEWLATGTNPLLQAAVPL